MENRRKETLTNSFLILLKYLRLTIQKQKVQINIHHEYRQKKSFKILANKIQQCILAMNMGTPKLNNTIPFTTEHMKKEYLGENLIIHT